MFCPTCGKSEQMPGTYCRQCGNFLSNAGSVVKRGFGGDTPQDQIKTNLILNLMSGIVSLVSGILLFVIFSGGDVYGKQQIGFAIAAFLLAMSGWQFSAFAVNLKLRKNLNNAHERQTHETSNSAPPRFDTMNTAELLPEADLDNLVPASVTENTTRHLGEKVKRKSS